MLVLATYCYQSSESTLGGKKGAGEKAQRTEMNVPPLPATFHEETLQAEQF